MNANNPDNAMVVLLTTLERMEAPDNRSRWLHLKDEGLQLPVVVAGIPLVSELFYRVMTCNRVRLARPPAPQDHTEISSHHVRAAISDAITALDRLNCHDQKTDNNLIDPVIQFTAADVVYSLNQICKRVREKSPNMGTSEFKELIRNICYDHLMVRRVRVTGGGNTTEPLGVHEEPGLFTVRGAPLVVYLKDHYRYSYLYGRDKFSVDMNVAQLEPMSSVPMTPGFIRLVPLPNTARQTGVLTPAMMEYVNSKTLTTGDSAPFELETEISHPGHPDAKEKPYTKAMFDNLHPEGETVESSTFLDDIKLVGIERLNRLGGGYTYLVYQNGTQAPVSVDNTSTIEQLYNELKRQ